MSALRVVWPDEDLAGSMAPSGGVALYNPDILPMAKYTSTRRSIRFDVIARARTLFANRTCPTCDYPVVTPVELDNATHNRNGQPIPGSATLVGFHCEGCGEEWSI
jgi:hypothetical protein